MAKAGEYCSKSQKYKFLSLEGSKFIQQIATNTTNSFGHSFVRLLQKQQPNGQKHLNMYAECLHNSWVCALFHWYWLNFACVCVRPMCVQCAFAKNTIFVETWNWKPIISVAVTFSRVLMHTAKYCNTMLWWCQMQKRTNKREGKRARASKRASGYWH